MEHLRPRNGSSFISRVQLKAANRAAFELNIYSKKKIKREVPVLIAFIIKTDSLLEPCNWKPTILTRFAFCQSASAGRGEAALLRDPPALQRVQKGAPSAPPAIPSPLRAFLVPLHGMGEHEHNRAKAPSSSFYFSSSSSPKARLWKHPAAEALPELHVGSGQRAPWHRAVGITPAARGGVEPQLLAQLSARLMRPRSEPSAPSCPLPGVLGDQKRQGRRASDLPRHLP